MRTRCVLLVAGALCTAVPPSIAADDSWWTLRFHGAIVDSSADDRTQLAGTFVNDLDVGGGVGVAAEYRLSRRLGFEVSVLFAGLEIGSSFGPGSSQVVDMGMVPITFGLPIHLNPEARADVFVAPTLSVVQYVDVETRFGTGVSGTTVDISSDTAPGAALCLDLPLGAGSWAFSTGLRYMATDADGTDIDPLIVTIGAAYRFSGGRHAGAVARPGS